MWGEANAGADASKFAVPAMDDGLIEVVGLNNIVHAAGAMAGRFEVGLGHGGGRGTECLEHV